MQSRPLPPGTFRALPIQTFAGFDTVYSINAALAELERGMFKRAAILSDAMGRDDRITAVTATRVGALLAAQLDVKPSDERPKSVECAQMLGGTEDAPGRWDRMFSQGSCAKLLKSGLHLNMGVAEIVWWYEDGLWWPRLNVWHSSFVRWDVTTETYKLQTANQNEIDLPNLDATQEADGNWFVWCPFGFQFSWLDGLIRSLAPMFMRRMWVNRDWARYNEVHGLPLMKAITPGSGGTGTSDDEFFESVANRGSDSTVMLKQGIDGEKYDVQLLEAVAKTYETFKDSKSDVNTDAAVLVLGQNLTTEAQGGGLGGGEAKTHNLVRIDKAREDAAFAAALYHQVLRPWARFNFKDPTLAPRPIYRVDPPEDEGHRADVLKKAGDGIAALQTAQVPVDVRQTAEEFGVNLLSPEEEAAQKAVAAEEAAAAAQAAADAQAAAGGAGGRGGNARAGGAGGPATLSARPEDARPVAKRYKFAGLDVAVEHPRGSMRPFHDANGAKTSEALMLNDYGFIEGHVGGDGEGLDVYVGPNEDATHVHVVHQRKPPEFERHDEDKIMLGFNSAESAKAAYLGNRSDAKAFGGMSVMPLDVFKTKLNRRRSSGKIRAAAVTDPTFAAIMRMASKTARLKGDVAGGEATLYPDQLTTRALSLGARALAADLRGVKAEVKEATSFEDLEKRMVAFYRERMDPEKFARIIQRSRLMANLAGRLAVVKGA